MQSSLNDLFSEKINELNAKIGELVSLKGILNEFREYKYFNADNLHAEIYSFSAYSMIKHTI